MSRVECRSRRLWAILLAVVVSASACGCNLLPPPLVRERYADNNPNAPHVYVLRGSVGIFPGAYDFQDVLAAHGIASTMTYCEAWPRVARQIIEERQSGCCHPIVLVGYSKGATASIHIARELEDEGIDVDAIVILEGCHHRLIPRNVRYCFNAYKPAYIPRLYGLPVEAECDETWIVNYNLLEHDCNGHIATLRHLSLPRDYCIHSLLTEQVLLALNSGCFADEPDEHDDCDVPPKPAK